MSYGFTLIISGSHNVFQKVNITFIKLYTYTYSELFTCDILPMSYIQNLNILGIRPSTIPIRKLFLSRWPSDYWSFYHWWRYCRVIMARLWHGFCSWWCSRTTVLWWYSVISSNIYSLSTDDNSITLTLMNCHHIQPHCSSMLCGSVAAFFLEHLYSLSWKCT